MKLHKNDEVIVIAGAHKGKRGQILAINPKKQVAIVAKINIIKRHFKPSQKNPDGGIVEKEAPIHISNLALWIKVGKNKSQHTKIGYQIKDGKKNRFARKTGKRI